ncbi:MAG TPA: EscU/YscU/HrcU family type III secretion system export apparatus switch protein [Anaeromyxobacteraceae bacterium]|nr:EscU/YscU/HrcU family type III secretion system export apparatus switch protein [Anaeromyxobacteraceae bacterium]
MADEEESRTEAPSEKRLQKAREEGQVPLGRDLPLVASIAAGTLGLYSMAGTLRAGLVHAMAEVAGSAASTPFPILPHLALGPLLAVAAVGLAAALGSALATLVQTKGAVWPDRFLPDLSRLFNASRLTQMLSRQTLTEIALAVVKVVALGLAAYSSLHADFMTLPALLGAPLADGLSRTFGILWRVGLRMLLAALVIAGADLALVHRRYMRKMRVTRQEAKRDLREDEGDPLVKGKRKQKHRALSRGRAKIEVPRADALLVNPTHIAIALRYRRDEGRAPRVLAKGKGTLAEYMRELARENAIPIVEDIPLARLLYRKVKVGGEIPASTYKAVATVLAFVYRLTGRLPAGKAATP